MKIVIDIPERDYDLACKYPNALIATYAHYIKDGKPYEERPTGEWIPVSERLPKYNKTVLISVKQIGKEARVFTAQRRKRFKTPDIFECCTDDDGWWDFRIAAWDDHEVLAWMPLPEPYKADS